MSDLAHTSRVVDAVRAVRRAYDDPDQRKAALRGLMRAEGATATEFKQFLKLASDDGDEAVTDRETYLTTFTAVRSRPAPTWRVAGLLPASAFVLLYAPPGAGKTLLSVSTTHAAAAGLDEWHGRAVMPSRPLWVVGEDVGGLAARSAAWESVHRGVELPEMALYERALQLKDDDDAEYLFKVVERGGHDFVVIETLARCIVGLEENSAKDMGPVLRNVEKLQNLNGGVTVVAHHHTTKDEDTYRGTSSLAGAADTMLSLRYVKDGAGARNLHVTKQKNGPYDPGAVVERFRVTAAGDSAVLVIEAPPKVKLRDQAAQHLTESWQTTPALWKAMGRDGDPTALQRALERWSKEPGAVIDARRPGGHGGGAAWSWRLASG